MAVIYFEICWKKTEADVKIFLCMKIINKSGDKKGVEVSLKTFKIILINLIYWLKE